MERLGRAHSCSLNASIAVDALGPSFDDHGFGGIDFVIALVIERHCLGSFLGVFDVGARPDSIVLEKPGSFAGFSHTV